MDVIEECMVRSFGKKQADVSVWWTTTREWGGAGGRRDEKMKVKRKHLMS